MFIIGNSILNSLVNDKYKTKVMIPWGDMIIIHSTNAVISIS